MSVRGQGHPRVGSESLDRDSHMSSLETLRAFFGWCTVINMGILIFASIVTGPMRGAIFGIHARMFGMSEADLPRAYFQYLAQYKIAIFVFNLVPYIALVIIA